MGRNFLPMVLACSSLATTAAAAQSNHFDVGAHFGASVQRVADGGDGWRGGIQAAVAIDERFDFYPGLTFSGTPETVIPLLAVRAWPLGRAEQAFVGWYLGAGMLADQATFLTGMQVGSGGLRPFLQAQVVGPEDVQVLLGLAIRVK